MNIICGPYLQNMTKHSVTIMWQTDTPATSLVEYGPCDGYGYGWSYYTGRGEPNLAETAESNRHVTVHAVVLEGLEAESVYDYRVRSMAKDGCSATSSAGSFRTAVNEGTPFKFATYADSFDHEEYVRNVQLVRSYRPEICVNVGDVAANSISRLKTDFFDCTQELLKYTPWFAAMGNHDAPNEGYFRHFCYPEPRFWYSFNYGCAHFSIVNSNMDFRSGSEQWGWLDNDLREFQDARWKFVFFHHPPFCSNNCEISSTRVMCSLFEKYGVDVVFNAHATMYERFHPLTNCQYDSENGVVYIVTGGGGYDMTSSSSQFWDIVHPFSAVAKAVNHFLLTQVTPDECSIRAIDNTDRVFDTLILTKPKAEVAVFPQPGQHRPCSDQSEDGTIVAGFEQGAVGWILPRSQYSLDSVVSHSGQVSVRWTSNGGKPVLPALRRVLADDGCVGNVVGGKRYEISAWVKTERIVGEAGVSFEWSGDMGFVGRVDSESLEGTNDWTLLELSVPTLSDRLYWCRIVLSAQVASKGTAWFDDVNITELAPSFSGEV